MDTKTIKEKLFIFGKVFRCTQHEKIQGCVKELNILDIHKERIINEEIEYGPEFL